MEMHEGYKKRLLFINGHLTAGGTEKCLVDVLRNIDFGKFQVDLLLVEGLGDYAAQLPSQVNVIYQNISHAYGPLVQTILHCIKTMNWRCLSIRVLLLLGKVFKHRIFHPMAHLLLGRRKYDYVIAARGGICADIASYGKISDKKYLWWHHGDLGLSSHDVVEQSLSNFSKIIAVSNTISRFLTNEFPQLSNRIVVVENGVDIDTVSKFGMLMNPYQNEKDTYIICSVGRINPEKRYELAVLSAKKLLLRGITDFKWYIVGDGIDFSKVSSLIKANEIEDHVIMIGVKANPYPYIANANLFVHTSYVESFGLSILEAMALKTPCVVTESRGPAEYIIDHVNGRLVEGTENDVADAICDLYYDRAKASKMADIGLETAQKYSQKNTAQQFNRYVLKDGE